MIVYVESNFILELAYLQEEHDFCIQLLELAIAKKIRLVVPNYCVAEAYHSWVVKSNKRLDINRKISEEIRELSRSKPYTISAQDLNGIALLLAESTESEKQLLDQRISEILVHSTLIAFEPATIVTATASQVNYDLSIQDSLVFASVMTHLQNKSGESKCFITKNSRDFGSTDVLSQFNQHNCKVLFKFQAGLGYIQSQL